MAPRGKGKFANASLSSSPSGTGRRRMELVASVSRSSGLGNSNGDALKDPAFQEEYRGFIQGKLDSFWQRFPLSPTRMESDADKRHRIDGQENLLILFRKLREGVSSTQRQDAFAIEVYEISFILAIIFESAGQATSILPRLLPDLYLTSPSGSSNAHCLPIVLLSLMFQLASGYPSQTTFQKHLQALPPSFLPLGSDAFVWITSIAAGLRTRNYVQLEKLTRKESWTILCVEFDRPATPRTHNDGLPKIAMQTLVDTLRTRARTSAWAVIRSAYRELSCHSGSQTREWISRSLLSYDADAWLHEKAKDGEVRPKEGVEGRWVLCKVRTT